MSETPGDPLISKIQEGHFAERILEVINDFVDRERRKIEEKVFKALAKGDYLDPQAAVQAWVEFRAVTELPAKLRKQARDGHVASEKLAKLQAS